MKNKQSGFGIWGVIIGAAILIAVGYVAVKWISNRINQNGGQVNDQQSQSTGQYNQNTTAPTNTSYSPKSEGVMKPCDYLTLDDVRSVLGPKMEIIPATEGGDRFTCGYWDIISANNHYQGYNPPGASVTILTTGHDDVNIGQAKIPEKVSEKVSADGKDIYIEFLKNGTAGSVVLANSRDSNKLRKLAEIVLKKIE